MFWDDANIKFFLKGLVSGHRNFKLKNTVNYRVSKKKCDLRRLVQNCTLLYATLLYVVFFNIFWKIVILLVLQNPPKKSVNLFSPKIKSSEKQKCVNKLFLSKSKIFKRFSKNWQNCYKKIRIFQFWSNLYGKIICL